MHMGRSVAGSDFVGEGRTATRSDNCVVKAAFLFHRVKVIGHPYDPNLWPGVEPLGERGSGRTTRNWARIHQGRVLGMQYRIFTHGISYVLVLHMEQYISMCNTVLERSCGVL